MLPAVPVHQSAHCRLGMLNALDTHSADFRYRLVFENAHQAAFQSSGYRGRVHEDMPVSTAGCTLAQTHEAACDAIAAAHIAVARKAAPTTEAANAAVAAPSYSA